MEYFFRKSLLKTLLPSNSAAAALGPKIRNPFSSKRSTIPKVNGSSGPTIVKSIPSLITNSRRPSISPDVIFRQVASLLIPALPGAQ